ncbi:SDR family NAD(P)-dependent oxidoreductase [Chromatocurvus halotolerans]|uniref:NAD(P)-dependent dehydrogenase (Short-subunit alcohol dehydrogenase family) n=1 Tax=Chromatocurvus halotolerans TaxID=1132028 RepID=A0A4R2L3G8_9GAMM|nr:SDR family oxidoreductase [Chromatocurvus halotolerans]TCO77108.1 NAD(P)-dependent dehydrogenase (short-subunit alcohol dehydrogenase family) [Chromatocurvus halotolerans]
MQDLTDRIILLTGASKGIGAATARFLGAAGATLIAHYGSDRDGAVAATADIPDERKLLVQADLANPDDVERLWAEACGWKGHIDVLVNNAAVMIGNGSVDEDLENWDAAWEKSMQINVLAPARMLRQAVRHFREVGGGSIITISSWAAQRGVGNPATIAYAASKAAIRAATQTVARNYASEGIYAYIIAPGVVRTRLSEDFARSQGGEDKVTAGLAMGRWVDPEEIADLVTFLCKGSAPSLSGGTIDINGASYIR